jgi:hypothetical protein
LTPYRIADEPTPGRWSRIAVHPLWPFFASMFGGAWLAWPWFVVNGAAIGSATRGRETLGALLGFAGAAGLALGLLALAGAGALGGADMGYALIAVRVWKIGVTYWLFTLQHRSFQLFEYFGGAARNGILLVLLGFFARSRLLDALGEQPFWLLVLLV